MSKSSSPVGSLYRPQCAAEGFLQDRFKLSKDQVLGEGFELLFQ